MEELKYVVDDSTIVLLLGKENFTNEESAILELVKNSFDAAATELNIIFDNENNTLIIKDNGNGMNTHDIRNNWMHIGKSDKGYEISDTNNNKRILAGSKGIGRFALSRLAKHIELRSQKNNDIDSSVYWHTDWEKTFLEELPGKISHGTTILLSDLRDRWSLNNINRLCTYLSRVYNSDLMKITIIVDDAPPIIITRYFDEPQLGNNCTSIIKFNYLADKQQLNLSINSDEFLPDAKKYCPDTNLTNFNKNIDIYNNIKPSSDDDLKTILTELGNFNAEFYFRIKSSNTLDMNKFFYKHKQLPNLYEDGIILYRNSFSITSYEGTKDWIGLGKRSRMSPAAATHPTGAWRIRENQIAGKVNIDKERNNKLEDLSNRQGLSENIYYKIFINILEIGLGQFEKYRQNIIRSINKNHQQPSPKKKIMDLVIKNPKKVKTFSDKELTTFVNEIKISKNDNLHHKREIKHTEERYKYDIRILNVLATSGLKATSIAHDVHNDRNFLENSYESIVETMKELDIWGLVNQSEYTQYSSTNIPYILKHTNEINKKFISFMGTMLLDVEKKQFYPQECDINKLLNNIKIIWNNDYSGLNIEILSPTLLIYTIPEDILKVIFDNLILNSIQQNEKDSKLTISIDVRKINNQLYFKYSDNGKGLDDRYVDDPMKILEVHETSRPNGHGLGMWIVNNTINMFKGEITSINGKNGFNIEFKIGSNK